MAASGDGDDITAGQTNHAASGTELICSPKDGHAGNNFVLRVHSGLVLDPIDGVVGQGSRVGVVGIGQTGVSGTGQVVGVVGRVGESTAQVPRPFDKAGMVGSASGNLAAGVIGESDVGAGVVGKADAGVGIHGLSTKGIAVFGTTDTGVGVRGESKSTGTVGVGDIGVKGQGVTTGVDGTSEKGTGVHGSSHTGVGVVAEANNSNLEALFAHNNGGGLAAFFLGGVRVQGNFTIFGGLKSAAVPHPDGSHRLLYCVESPESWFEDFGEGRLADGNVEVLLDPDFAVLVEVAGYHVFVTPYGECKGLFVAERRATAFRVVEQQGGVGNVSFGYRVVAKRKDVVGRRLAVATPHEGSRSFS